MNSCDCKDERRDHVREPESGVFRDLEEMVSFCEKQVEPATRTLKLHSAGDMTTGQHLGILHTFTSKIARLQMSNSRENKRMADELERLADGQREIHSLLQVRGKRHKLGKMEFTKWQAVKFGAVAIGVVCALVVATKVSTMDFSISTKGVVLHTEKVAHE